MTRFSSGRAAPGCFLLQYNLPLHVTKTWLSQYEVSIFFELSSMEKIPHQAEGLESFNIIDYKKALSYGIHDMRRRTRIVRNQRDSDTSESLNIDHFRDSMLKKDWIGSAELGLERGRPESLPKRGGTGVAVTRKSAPRRARLRHCRRHLVYGGEALLPCVDMIRGEAAHARRRIKRLTRSLA